jgi:hypothetical protein
MRALIGLEEGGEPFAQRLVSGTGLVEVGFPLRAFGPFEGLPEVDFFSVVSGVHPKKGGQRKDPSSVTELRRVDAK